MTADEAKALGVRVRALEWSRESPYFVARVFGGHYAIEVWDGGVTLSGTFFNRHDKTLEAAKLAAQADYTARIFAALEATT